MSSDTKSITSIGGKDEGRSSNVVTDSEEKTAAKRRTKTGCLTCRRRRIKCGEEQPICKNCIKSKRECSGYNPPLVYKQHTSSVSASTPFVGSEYGHSRHSLPSTDYMWDPLSASSHEALNNATLQTVHSNLVDHNHPAHAPFSGSSTGTDEWPGSATFRSDGTPLLVDSTPYPRPTIQESIPPATTPLYFAPVSFDRRTPHNVSGASVAHGVVDRPVVRTQEYEYEDADDPFDVVDDDQDHAYNRNNVLAQEYYTGHFQGDDLPPPSLHEPKSMAIELSEAKSPLFDERNHRYFQHFLDFSAPFMSIFDRLDVKSHVGVPKMVWRDMLPVKSFRNPGLAHAILAIGSLHVAKIEQMGEDVAAKHLIYALRRIRIMLEAPQTRHEITTLASVLLVGYYEVAAGDQSRWSLHLSGAAKLVREHDFAQLIKKVRRMRYRAKVSMSQSWLDETGEPMPRHNHIPNALVDGNDWDVDQNLVSKFSGQYVDYDNQTQSNFKHRSATSDLAEVDIDNLKILMELNWWYCKQDVFQSMLSGDPLMLPYHQWIYCPPRGRLNVVDKPHATVDHLWLLLARLTSFGAKDRLRKQRVIADQGGQWIPAPGFLTPLTKDGPFPMSQAGDGDRLSARLDEPRNQPPPSANEGRTRKPKSSISPASSNESTPMYGMIPPPTGPTRMSSSFKAMDAELQKQENTTPSERDSPATDPEIELKRALEEIGDIQEGFDLFESLLGPEFQPLPTDPSWNTPFGPAIRYSSPVIAAMWTFYYVGRILLRRMHPHSPPAAMVSVGVNALATRPISQMIGRICGGLHLQQVQLAQAGRADLMVVAAMMETTFSLLFAAVQFQDPIQRAWTIGRFRNAVELTGWPSSLSMAAACETTWNKMGLAKKGPPYEPTLERNASGVRVQSKGLPGRTSDMDPVEEHESRFISHDRSLIDRHNSTRTYYALGLLSVEEDLEKLSVKD